MHYIIVFLYSFTSETLYTCVDVRVGYEHTSYTVSEAKDHEELCVTSLSPGIDESFIIYTITDSKRPCFTLIAILT